MLDKNCKNSFYQKIFDAKNLCQPVKTARFKGDKPWITSEIKVLIKQRQDLHKKKLHDEWKMVAGEVRCSIRAAKRKYYYKIANGNFKAWDEINKIQHPKSSQVPDVELATKQNDGFYKVWNGQKQPDISDFINNNPSAPRPTIFSESIVEQAIKRQKSGGQINYCILRSFVNPNQWKFANITPIPKIDHPKESGD